MVVSMVERLTILPSTLRSIRPEPFGSELKAELLMAEGRPKGAKAKDNIKTLQAVIQCLHSTRYLFE